MRRFSCFVIPGESIKNGEERLVVLNKIAKSVVEGVRGCIQPMYLFAHKPKTARRGR